MTETIGQMMQNHNAELSKIADELRAIAEVLEEYSAPLLKYAAETRAMITKLRADDPTLRKRDDPVISILTEIEELYRRQGEMLRGTDARRVADRCMRIARSPVPLQFAAGGAAGSA